MIERLRFQDDDRSPHAARARAAEARDALLAQLVEETAGQPELQGMLQAGVHSASVFLPARELGKNAVITLIHEAKLAFLELGRRLVDRGHLATVDLVFMATEPELDHLVADPSALAGELAARAATFAELADVEPPYIVRGEEGVAPISSWPRRGSGPASARATVGDVLQGGPGSAGTVTGRARVVLDPMQPGDVGPGDIMVAPTTDPSWTPLFLSVDGVVCDVGAVASHAAIVCRELGVPCAVSVVGATTRIPDGATISVDGSTGRVEVLAVPEVRPGGPAPVTSGATGPSRPRPAGPRSGRALEPRAEEGDDPLDARLVAVLGEHGVVPARGARQLDGHERVAEQAAQGVEPPPDEAVAGEAQPEHLASRGGALGHRQRVVGREPHVRVATGTAHGERQRGLRQDRRHHHVVDHHPEREPAAEAHAHRADPRPAELEVQRAGERPQPRHHRRGLVARPGRELAGDADARERGEGVGRRHRPPGRAHERRHHDGEAGGDDVVREPGDGRRDPGDLVHDDHTGAAAAAVRRPLHAGGGERAPLPTREHAGVVAVRHGRRRTASSARSASISTPTRKRSTSTSWSPIAPCR
jgi:phosphohistidine swiveling domain-containing protein